MPVSKKKIVCFLLFLFALQSIAAQAPAVEVRGAWLTTIWGNDWPSDKTNGKDRKQELCDMLDKLQRANFNTVFFQVRLRGDVFYKSAIEPPNFVYSNLNMPNFDPLAFVLAECHKRGMECHAWFVVFPLGNKQHVAKHAGNSIADRYKDICCFYEGTDSKEWHLNPGHPEARKYILSLVDEIVSNYDIDGIQLDHIRYPNGKLPFPDDETYRRYGNKMTLDNWRRNNINKLVGDIYYLVKNQKPWVQVSSATIGKYKPLSPIDKDLTAYNDVYQDPAYWLKNGIHDAIYPMMYYKNFKFEPFLLEWKKYSYERLIIPGLGAYMFSEAKWPLKVVTDQIDLIRRSNIKGQGFFRTQNIVDNTNGILDKLQSSYYRSPAKLPPLTWLHKTPPEAPENVTITKFEDGQICISWAGNQYEDLRYTVYQFTKSIDVDNPQQIISTGKSINYFCLDAKEKNSGMSYAVTASDRYHNESKPSKAVKLTKKNNR